MYEVRAGRAIQQVTAIRQAVEDMFAAAGCDTPAARELLGPGGVTAANLMQYLGIVEQEADQLLQVRPLQIPFAFAQLPPCHHIKYANPPTLGAHLHAFAPFLKEELNYQV